MYWPGLDELDAEHVEFAHAIILQMIEEKCPSLNADRGVVGSLVTELHAIFQGCSMQAIDKLQHSLCARDVAVDPSSALPAAVDALASNFRVHRKISRKATGTITVVLNRASGDSFGTNTKFRANGQFFYVTQKVIVKPQVRGPHDVAAVQLEAGTYSVQIPVIANEVHPAAMLHRFDKLVPLIRPPGFVDAYATADFVGGVTPQSNKQLVDQFRVSLATPGFSNVDCIKALVHQSGVDVSDIAVIGARDDEMTRDHNADGVSVGGCLDIYIRIDGPWARHIADIQEYLDNPDVRQPGLSVKVMAATPVQVDVQVKAKGFADHDAIHENLAKYVNGLPIGTPPTQFQLVRAVQDIDGVEDVSFEMANAFDKTCAAYLNRDILIKLQ